MKLKNIALLLTLSSFSILMHANNPTLFIDNDRQSPITVIVEKYNTSGSATGLATSTQEMKIGPKATKELGFIPHWKRKLDGCIAKLSIKPEGVLSSAVNLEKIIETVMNQESQHPNKNCHLIINPESTSSAYPIAIQWK